MPGVQARRIRQADRIYLLRRGSESRGIVGSGVVTRGSYEDAHWNDTRRADGDVAPYVHVKWRDLVDADKQPDDVLTLERNRVSDESSQALEELWQHTDRHHCFVAGKHYTRESNQRLLGLQPTNGGDWATGHHREGNDTYIFATVGQPGQTGHQAGRVTSPTGSPEERSPRATLP